jgi:hypothetical protein
MTPMVIRGWMKGFGGRRFLLCVGTGLCNIPLLILHYLDPSTFRDITIGTIGAYVAGDYLQNRLQNRWPPPGPTYNGQVDNPDMR